MIDVICIGSSKVNNGLFCRFTKMEVRNLRLQQPLHREARTLFTVRVSRRATGVSSIGCSRFQIPNPGILPPRRAILVLPAAPASAPALRHTTEANNTHQRPWFFSESTLHLPETASFSTLFRTFSHLITSCDQLLTLNTTAGPLYPHFLSRCLPRCSSLSQVLRTPRVFSPT